MAFTSLGNGDAIMGVGRDDWRATLIWRQSRTDMSSIHLHWVGFCGNRHSFVFAWPRRDNRWARWRYTVFTKEGQCLVWNVSSQTVMW
jgi:hypothetical protein